MSVYLSVVCLISLLVVFYPRLITPFTQRMEGVVIPWVTVSGYILVFLVGYLLFSIVILHSWLFSFQELIFCIEMGLFVYFLFSKNAPIQCFPIVGVVFLEVNVLLRLVGITLRTNLDSSLYPIGRVLFLPLLCYPVFYLLNHYLSTCRWVKRFISSMVTTVKVNHLTVYLSLFLTGCFYHVLRFQKARQFFLIDLKNNQLIRASEVLVEQSLITLETISLFLFVVMVLLYHLSCLRKELIEKDNQKKQLLTYVTELEHVQEDLRRFQHDYQNIMSAFGTFLIAEDYQGLGRYYEKVLEKLPAIKETIFREFADLTRLRTVELKGLVASKIMQAREKGITVNLEIAEPIADIQMDAVDLMRILGIMLDNAIEAAEQATEEKRIDIAFITTEKKDILIIKNTHAGALPAVYTMFQEGYSSKGEGRGLGLSNLLEIVQNYGNVMLDSIVEEETFEHIVMIWKINEIETE